MKTNPEDIDISMISEIKQAAEFLTKLVTTPHTEPAVYLKLMQELIQALTERYKNHWFVEDPERGQAYRAVEISKGRQFYDSMLLLVAANLGFTKADLRLPYDICIWVDPGDVAVRFGEELGAFLPVWSKNTEGAMISYIDKFDFARLCERPTHRAHSYTPNYYKSQSKTCNSQFMDAHRIWVSIDQINARNYVLDESSPTFPYLTFELNSGVNGNSTPTKSMLLNNGNVSEPICSPAKVNKTRISNRNR